MSRGKSNHNIKIIIITTTTTIAVLLLLLLLINININIVPSKFKLNPSSTVVSATLRSPKTDLRHWSSLAGSRIQMLEPRPAQWRKSISGCKTGY
jgi:hypothetical protein